MPDPERIAQARVAEIPVTIQGSKTTEGTEQRELFTENAKTALTFPNGAVLNLQSRVSPGQSLFLRNEQTGREILCRVQEAPPEGQQGYTDLEFTVPDPEFWGVDTQQPEAAAEQPAPAVEKPEAHQETEAAHEDPLAMMSAAAPIMTAPSAPSPAEPSPSAESSAPVHEEIMPAYAQAPEPPASSPSHDAQEAPPQPVAEPEFNAAKFEENLAALLEGDAQRAKHAAVEKEKEAKRLEREAASQNTSEEATDAGVVLSEAKAAFTMASLAHKLTTGKGAIVVEIAASVVIAVALGFIWHAVAPTFLHGSSRASAASSRSTQAAPHAAPRPSQAPAATVAAVAPATAGTASTKTGNSSSAGAEARVNNAGAAPAQLATKVQQPAVAQPPAVPIAKTPDAMSSAKGDARGGKAVESSLAPAGTEMAASRSMDASNPAAGEGKHRKPNETNSPGNIPARIVSQSQPALPSWAKSLDVDGVVTLDALIDEKGNVAQTKVLFGPRLLQRAAEQAVGLWIFEPALTDGKPVATHMILTVEFQR